MSSDNPLEEISRAQVFDSYERALVSLAEDIAEEVNSSQDAVDGREWCEEHGIPETAFADAVNRRMVNVTYGVSPMYPFTVREEEEVEVVPVESETEDEVEEQGEVDDGSESDEE